MISKHKILMLLVHFVFALIIHTAVGNYLCGSTVS